MLSTMIVAEQVDCFQMGNSVDQRKRGTKGQQCSVEEGRNHHHKETIVDLTWDSPSAKKH